MLEPEIEMFISRLIARIRNEENKGTFASVMEDLELSKGTWDKVARKRVGRVVKEVFQQSFPGEKAENVYVEGEGTPKWWKPPYELFGSKGVYPDIGILLQKLQKRIAIELDHSETRRTEIPGSRFKVALAKASFAYTSGDWDCCFAFFHNHSGKTMKQYLDKEIEKSILQKYEKEFHTKIMLFE
jgi:hypothetical protein